MFLAIALNAYLNRAKNSNKVDQFKTIFYQINGFQGSVNLREK
jgi:hypothetical protein